MSGSRSFVDTNVLVYAHDRSAGRKRDVARMLLEGLWDSGSGCVSVQVLQEFFVTVTRKVPRPLDTDTAAGIVADLSRWRVHAPAPEDVLAAIDLHRQRQISFWDAMIVHSAASLGCDLLLSEDLGSGQRFGAIDVGDPFAR